MLFGADFFFVFFDFYRTRLLILFRCASRGFLPRSSFPTYSRNFLNERTQRFLF